MENAGTQHRFGRFILDVARGTLTAGDEEIPLRPKTFAVLLHLVRNPERLISKEELLEAVWPNLIVTDDTLVQSVGELRRALGDAGASLIVTVPRRGYRFVPAVAPGERRNAPGAHPLRWRWKYGLIIPFALIVVVAGLWLTMRVDPDEVVAPSEKRPAIAVLPFQNQGEPGLDYLSDGLTQDLIQSLGRFSGLTVMSWNAVASYRGAAVRPGEIARSLDVRYQVEGSVRHTADQVRVSAQLVDERGRVLWSAIFEEPRAGAVYLPDRITGEIAGALSVRVTEFEQQRVATKPAASFDAYELVLRARPALRRPTRAGIVEARTLLREALARDPDYAAAHSALGDTFHIAISMGWAESPDTYWERARDEANAALTLDPRNVKARILLGRVYIAYNQYEEAEREIERAIELNPSDADALAGRGNILMWLGRTDAAIESLELAQRIDPALNAFDRFALSLAYYLKKRYDAAIDQARLNLVDSEEAHFSNVVLAASLAQLGRNDEAAVVVDTIRRTDPTFDASIYGSKFVRSGDLEHLREGLRKAGLY
jgi:TolB-like protein/DNA-binding winged helix-turn-helix (wHTH) protein/Tfp pilus assembly protein PilF